MKVYIDFKNVEKEISASTVAELLESLEINPTTVLVTRSGVLLTEDASLKKEDEIRILSVISGG